MTFTGYRGIVNDHPSELLARRHDSLRVGLILFALLATVLVASRALAAPYQGWSLPGADEGGGHFSHATQITPDNVGELDQGKIKVMTVNPTINHHLLLINKLNQLFYLEHLSKDELDDIVNCVTLHRKVAFKQLTINNQ